MFRKSPKEILLFSVNKLSYGCQRLKVFYQHTTFLLSHISWNFPVSIAERCDTMRTSCNLVKIVAGCFKRAYLINFRQKCYRLHCGVEPTNQRSLKQGHYLCRVCDVVVVRNKTLHANLILPSGAGEHRTMCSIFFLILILHFLSAQHHMEPLKW